MFQFLFRYPAPVFTKGHFVLLGTWPRWLLILLILTVACGLALAIRSRLRDALPKLKGWRVWVLWGMQSTLLALLLLLLWQPAIRVAELSSQQNIIAVIVDDSRSMSIADADGKPREAAALKALNDGVLSGLAKRFQTRLYRLDSHLTRVDDLKNVAPTQTATHIGDALQQFATETADLPVGAVVLLTDGGENTVGIGGSALSLDAMQSLRNRRLPVHTVGFGRPQPGHDIEVEDVSAPATAIANARVTATVSFIQHGFAGQKATLTVRDGTRLLAAREISLLPDGVIQTEAVFFPAGSAAAKTLRFGLDPLPAEENTANNALARPVLVSDAKRRILYIEGEPRWEYKFIRRAEDDDPTVQVVSMLRTSENKIYRQGIGNPAELAEGFPLRPEDLFGYAGIIIGSVDADYFTPLQQELLREYVDRRGGGILFLGGRSALSDGGWGASSLSELLPTFLPPGRSSFHRNAATVELTAAGMDSPITRLLDDPGKNSQRWKKLAYLADYEDPGSPKPGATVLAEMNAGRRKLPLLITQNYGHGRTAVLATGGTWRWQMSEALGDPSHDLFWQQLLRWLVVDSPGPVSASIPDRTLLDGGHVQLSANVRDPQFQPAADAHVTAHIVGPQGINAIVDLQPSQETPGLFRADWTAEKPGGYIAEFTANSAGSSSRELGRDVVTFQREDGVGENFHTAQDRRLLEQLSSQTGGRYWNASDLKDLPRDISYSEAGISVRSTKELWNLPIVFLVLLALPLAEWLLRRKWGVV
ncbi:MAG TPA: hypothetical protein VM865_09070 [Acidobacteriaceae bacterium]|jgi:hypothetical protein|nr:hypothetical protein [Acidobacteriaceae bacterium]